MKSASGPASVSMRAAPDAAVACALRGSVPKYVARIGVMYEATTSYLSPRRAPGFGRRLTPDRVRA